MATIGIYKITNPKGKIYIGQSLNCEYRKNSYKSRLCKTQPLIYRSILKYGWENHNFQVIHECESEWLDFLEMFYILLYDSYNSILGMNCTTGGGIGSKGKSHSLKAKEKISKGNKGKIISLETRDKIRKTLTGIKHTPERRRNQSIAKKGIPTIACSEDKKQKISISNTGKKRTSDWIKNRTINHPCRRPVLNTQNGVFYFDVKDAANAFDLNYGNYILIQPN